MLNDSLWTEGQVVVIIIIDVLIKFVFYWNIKIEKKKFKWESTAIKIILIRQQINYTGDKSQSVQDDDVGLPIGEYVFAEFYN